MSTDPEDIIAAAIADVTGDRPEIWTAEAAHAVERLRSAGQLVASGTWSLPAEPGPEVIAVRDASGRLWHAPGHGPHGDHPFWRLIDEAGFIAISRHWAELLGSCAPLTDATGEPA